MFLTKDDLLSKIRTYRLDQIIDNDDTVLELVFAETQSDLNNFLFEHYDADAIMNASGTARNDTILGWARHLAIYKLYERIPDSQVPERVVKNYDDVMQLLRKVSTGDYAMNFPRKQAEEGGAKTQFQWASTPRRRNANR
jgi:hypothetical protein